MHEFSVTQSLIELCEQEAKKNDLKKVYRIHLRLGKFTGFSSESIKFYFNYLKPETRCQDAEITFEEIPIKVQCRACKKTSTIEEPIMLCPECGGTDIEIISGREFYVDSIEGE